MARRRFGISFAVLCGTAMPVWAQSTAPAAAPDQATATAPSSVTDIIVTAQKRSERINSVPLTITALSSEQILARGITDTEQLQRVVPGFTVQKSYFNQPVFFIRGVGFSDTLISVNPAVSIYTDEVPLPFSAMARGAAIDLERVEVLKGPQGTLFGQNSTGGAVNYIAAKPTNDLSAGIDVTAGRFNQLDATAFVSGPLSDTISARLAVQNEHSGDWQRSVSRPSDTRGRQRFINARASIDFHPSDQVKVRLTGQAWRDRSDLQAQQFVVAAPQIPFSPPADPAVLAWLASQPAAPDNNRVGDWDPGSPTARNDKFKQVSLRADVNVTDSVTFTSITSYADLKSYTPVDIDGSPFPNNFTQTNAHLKVFTQELRLAGNLPGLNWLAGANYSYQNTKESQLDQLNGTNNSTTPFPYHYLNIFDNQRVNNYAGFANLDYKLTDTVTVRAGGRYNKEDRTFNGCLADAGDGTLAAAFGFISTIFSGSPTVIPPGTCVTFNDVTAKPIGGFVQKSLDQHNFSWRVGVDWKPVQGTMVYANIAKGYKSGSFTTVPAVFARQTSPVTQESLLAYEIGLKSALLDRHLQLNLATFYYKYSDKQLQGYLNILPFGNLPALVNIPKSKVKGVEFDVTAQVTPYLRLQGSGTVLDTKVTQDTANPVCPIAGPCTFVGERFPYTPKYQLTGDIEQRIPLGNANEGYVGASALYHSATTGSFGADQSAVTRVAYGIPAYTLIDLRAGIRFNDHKWRAEIFGRNITNKFYLVGAGRTFDEVTRFTGTPATYGVRLSWRL